MRNGERVKVCKTFFINTLSITPKVIRTVVAKYDGATNIIDKDYRGLHKKHINQEPLKNDIRQFLSRIPKIQSHYCRTNTNKQYIEGGKTVASLHRDYVTMSAELLVAIDCFLMYSIKISIFHFSSRRKISAINAMFMIMLSIMTKLVSLRPMSSISWKKI